MLSTFWIIVLILMALFIGYLTYIYFIKEENYTLGNVNIDKVQLQIKAKSDNDDEELSMLADLYHHGIADRYYNYQKIIGTSTDAETAINTYLKLIKKGHINKIIDLAELYHYGMANFPPQLDKAKELYIFAQSLDVSKANEYLDILNKDCENQEDEENYKPDDDEYYNPIDELWTLRGSNISHPLKHELFPPQLHQLLNPINPRIIDDTPPRINPHHNNDILNDIFNYDIPVRLGDGENNILDKLKNDVHETTIRKCVEGSAKKLKESTPIIIDKEKSLDDVRKLINNKGKGAKVADALKALDSINNSNGKIYNTNMSPADAIHLVWNRINSYEDEEIKNGAKDTLIDEIASCVEQNKVVCSPGKFSRIIDTLNGVDDAVHIVNDGLLREEMLNKANKIKTDIFNQLPPDEQTIVNKLKTTDTETMLTEKYENNVKEKIKESFKKDYVDSGVASEEKVNNEVNGWINEIF